MKNYLLFFIAALLAACSTTTKEKPVAQEAEVTPQKQRPVSLDNGKFFELEGKKMLYGGEDSTQHFDITDYDLNDGQFHYGIGREKFPALLAPEFVSVTEADTLWADSTRFLVAYAGDDIKAYAVKDLIRHEVVNDVLDGKPIMAAYCILADLGAIYDRQYGDHELTFALSGYTYYDTAIWGGLDGFVLWDRETESLWWPLIDRAVSGPLKGVELIEMDTAHWEDTNWENVKKIYPGAQVLKSGQDFERPKTWIKYDEVDPIVSQFSISE